VFLWAVDPLVFVKALLHFKLLLDEVRTGIEEQERAAQRKKMTRITGRTCL
jgi:hypothetical protein